MNLKNAGKMYRKQTVNVRGQKDVQEIIIKNLNGTLLDLQIKLTLCLINVIKITEQVNGLFGWMQIPLFIVLGRIKTLWIYYLRITGLHMLAEERVSIQDQKERW